MQKLLTVEEVAEHFRFTKDTVWKRCRDNAWPHRREGRNYRFSPQDVRDIEDLMNPAPAKRKARNARQQFKERLAS